MNERYSFEIFVKAAPDLDSIMVNDTIWLEVNESVVLEDLVSNEMIKFDNLANLGSAVAFNELLGYSQSRDAVVDFNYILVTGVETGSVNPARFKEYLFKEESERHKFKLGIIAKKAGTFRIGFSDAANVYKKKAIVQRRFLRFILKKQISVFILMMRILESQLPCQVICIVSK